MVLIGKHGNKIAVHMRRRRKAVQEQNGGSISGTGFAIEDFQPLHVKRAIENGRRTRIFSFFPIHYGVSFCSCHALLSFSFRFWNGVRHLNSPSVDTAWALGNPRVLTDESE